MRTLEFDDHDIELPHDACVVREGKLLKHLADMIDAKYPEHMQAATKLAIKEYDKLIEVLK